LRFYPLLKQEFSGFLTTPFESDKVKIELHIADNSHTIDFPTAMENAIIIGLQYAEVGSRGNLF
jgi:hypothetical protein